MKTFGPVFALLLISVTASAQASNPAVGRDAQAIAVLQRSLASLGSTNISAVTTAEVKGTLVPTSGSYVPAGNFTWLDDFSGGTFEFRHEIDTLTAQRVLVSGHGSPAAQQGAKVVTMRQHSTATALPYHLPGILLAHEIADASYSIQMGETSIVEGRPAVQVILKSATGPVERSLSEQHWYFDSTTFIPLRIEYRLASVLFVSDSIPGAVELSNYRLVDGVMVPFRIAVFENGTPTSVATVSSVVLNIADSSSEFDLPTGGAQ